MAKIVLIPNLAGEPGQTPSLRPPLGLISLATVLKRDGFEDVEIFDLNPLLPNHSYEQLCDAIMARSPAVLGFSTMCDNYLSVLKLAGGCKRQAPGLKVILGGPQATVTDAETLQTFPFIDVIARGECETNISAIMRALLDDSALADVAGVTFRGEHGVIRNAMPSTINNLDILPLPDYGLYHNLSSLKQLHVEVGRGCPFECTFCSTNDFWSRKYRLRSTGRQIELLRTLTAAYGFKRFVFDHDNLTANRARVIALCRGIRHAGLEITWRCSCRIDCIDPDLMQEMASAGCNRVYLGIETGSPRMQKLIKKKLDLMHAVDTVEQLLTVGIRVTASFIMGFPQETLEDLLQTIDLMLRLRFAGNGMVNIFLFMLAPNPQTPLFETYRHSLRFDGNLSVIAYRETSVEDREVVTHHPEIFAAYHYYDTPHLSRDFLLRTHFLIDHLLLLPNTLRMLWEDPQLGFPGRFLDQVAKLKAPSLAHYHTEPQLLEVSAFVSEVLIASGYADHRVLEMLRREININRVLSTSLGPGIGIYAAERH